MAFSTPVSGRPIEVFFSYAHQDEALHDELAKHLRLLERQGIIAGWHDRRITGGTEWAGAIDDHLRTADIILLLVSASFLASDYCYDVELTHAMDRHNAGEARVRVVPIILRPVDWHSAPFGKLQALPKDGRPVTSWANPDEAFFDIARGIRSVAEELAQTTAAPPVGTRPVGLGQPVSLPPIWNVPHPRNPNFTGRDDLLEALHGSGTDAQPVVLTQVLRGLGGIGKTQLALEYAYRYGREYCLVWWVRAEEPETLVSDYAALAKPLSLPQQTAQDQQETIAAVRQWLEHHDRWLLILDNAPEPKAVHAYLPRTTHGHIIMTSRHFGWGGTARSLTVPILPREEAVKLLLDVTQQSDAETAGAIAETLGDLPLALAQAAAYIDATGLILSAYLERLKTQLEVLLNRGEVNPSYPATVAMTWKMAFEALQEAYPVAISILKLCAFFAPDDIPYALLRDKTSALLELLSGAATDDLQWDDVLVALRHYALIEVGKEALAVHRLVQAVTRDRLPVDERTQWAEAAVKRVAAAFPGSSSVFEPWAWPTCARYLPHAVAVVSHVSDTDHPSEDTGWLLNQMGLYLHSRAQFEEAKPYLERALAIHEQVLGPQHPDTAQSLNNLGYLLRAQGDLSGAKPYYERALAINEQVLGPQHPDTAQSLNNLGFLLQAQGDLSGAKPYYERALAINEKVLGLEHPNTALSLNNLGVLLRAQGDLSGAKPYYERALAIREQVLGLEHPNTAQSLNNLGFLLQAQGDLSGAKSYFERALAIREQVLGPQHPDTAQSLNNLGVLLYAQGDLSGAKPYYERALAICEQVLGLEHPDTAGSLNNLGFLLRAQGDLSGAKPYYERALAVCEQVLGPQHPDTALSLNNLGSLLQAQGDLSGAKPCLERALAINEQVLGPQHPNTALSLNSLGSLLQAQGDLSGAKSYLERALVIRERVLGLEHPDTALSLNNLGFLLQAQGDLSDAKSYLERALAICEQVLGSKHPDTAHSLSNLGALLRAQGDLSGAKLYYERALAIREQVLGPEHPDTANSLNNLGALLQAQGDLAGAKPYYERALHIFRFRLGQEHPLTQSVQAHLKALETSD